MCGPNSNGFEFPHFIPIGKQQTTLQMHKIRQMGMKSTHPTAEVCGAALTPAHITYVMLASYQHQGGGGEGIVGWGNWGGGG